MTSLMRRTRRSLVGLAVLGLAVSACSSGDDGNGSSGGRFGADELAGGEASSYEPTGELIADTGFRPEADGFAFANYGASEYENMTELELRELFGDDVCVDPSDDPCQLTPAAQAWLEQTNGSMDGGHCYGFSVTALQLYTGDQDVEALGGSAAVELPIDGNPGLQREIAQGFSYQYLDSVTSSKFEGPPSAIIAALTESLAPDLVETYTIGIFRADGGGGHAVTPYAVEDNGDGQFHVLVYDNNFPGITRAIEIDTNAETWRYVAAVNPDEPEAVYEGQGDTNPIKLFPTTPGQGEQSCPFCLDEAAAATGAAGFGAAPAAPAGPAGVEEPVHIVYLDGDPRDHGHLTLTTPDGLRTGYVDGALVNEIPGAEVVRPFTDNYSDNPEPVYVLPVDVPFDITIDGTGMEEPDVTSVGLIGPGYELAIEEFELVPGDAHALALDPVAGELLFTSNAEITPAVGIGYETADAAYAFVVQTAGLATGDVLRVLLPADGLPLILDTTYTSTPGLYALFMGRYDAESELEFENEGVELAPGETAALDYAGWVAEGTPITFTVTRADGAQEVEELADE